MARTFQSGATRDEDDGKLDFEGFLSPLALERYAEYMHEHRMIDGKLRPSDNWQKGIPPSAYMKSMWRHFFDVWALYRRGRRGETVNVGELSDALCAVLFNAMGFLHELMKAQIQEEENEHSEIFTIGEVSTRTLPVLDSDEPHRGD